MKKCVDKRIDECVLRWFHQVDRMDNGRIAKRLYIRECVGSRSVGRPSKRWIDSLMECLKKV